MVIVHVYRQRIDSNRKHGSEDPPIIVRRGKEREYGNSVRLIGNARIIYSKDTQLDCGARVWIEADDAEVES